MRSFIAIASGKGGVGKSTTAWHLAQALRDLNVPVGLLDADIYGPSLAGWSHCQVTEDSLKPPVWEGIPLVSMGFWHNSQGKGAHLFRGPMVTRFLQHFLNMDWGKTQLILVDFPPGTGDIPLSLSQMISFSGSILVTTPQDVAIWDVKKTIGMFQTLQIPIWGLVETMSFLTCSSCETIHHPFGQGGAELLAQEYHLPLLEKIPLIPNLAVSSGGKTSDELKKIYENLGKICRDLWQASCQTQEGLDHFRLLWNPKEKESSC